VPNAVETRIGETTKAVLPARRLRRQTSILEIIFLNFQLEDAKLSPTMRKPFDVLVEGHFVQASRADWIRTSDLSPRRPL